MSNRVRYATIGLLAGLLAGSAHASLVYNLSLSGDIAGSGKLVLKDGALDTDGIFELGPQLLSFELSVPSVGVTFTSLSAASGSGAEYKVVGGVLKGADLYSGVSSAPFWYLDFGNFAAGVVIEWGAPKRNIFVKYSPSMPPPGSACTSSTDRISCDGTISAEAAPPVPLPAAAWLLLSGLAGLGAMGRRRT